MSSAFRSLAVISILVCAFGAAAQNSRKTIWTVLKEIYHERYPGAPKELTSDPASSTVLIIDGMIVAPIRNNCPFTHILLSRVDDPKALFRAGELPRHHGFFDQGASGLVLFHDLPPGTYSLELVQGRGGRIAAFAEVPETTPQTVEIKTGTVTYMGFVTAQLYYLNRKPPTVTVKYDPEAERRAWQVFKERYPTSSWSKIVDARIESLPPPATVTAK